MQFDALKKNKFICNDQKGSNKDIDMKGIDLYRKERVVRFVSY